MGAMLTGCGAPISDVPIETLVGEKIDYSAEAASREAEASKIDYTQFEGQFSDTVSRRATATVTANGRENARIVVNWSSAASETNRWTMTVTYESGKLNYTDCKLEILQTDADGNESGTTLYDDGKGYFEWSGGALNWAGAAEESCQPCVFVKIAELEE